MKFESFAYIVYKYIKVSDGQKTNKGCCEWSYKFNELIRIPENSEVKLDKNNAEVFVNV